MENILANETEIERKLRELDAKKKSVKNLQVNLRQIKTPKDLGAIAEKRRQSALERNSLLLQELDIESAKLHTKRLCPIHSRLQELKSSFLRNP